MVLGPFDKRAQKKRCAQCQSRHVKCEGSPCTACVRKGLDCVFKVPQKRAIKLTVVDGDKRRSLSISSEDVSTVSKIPCQIPSHPRDRIMVHFCASFLSLATIPATPNCAATLPFEASPALLDIASAIGFLHLRNESKSAEQHALRLYASSVVTLQDELQLAIVPGQQDSVLWRTFLLGIFELMYDSTGQGWTKHFLYGTSKLLEQFGPKRCLQGGGRTFFLTVRIFEISRALIFTQPTFLSTTPWTNLTTKLWQNESIMDWHPKEALLDLMTSCAELGVRAMRLVHSLMDLSPKLRDEKLREIAVDGTSLRGALQGWESSFTLSPTARRCDQMTLSLILHRAISIYLSGLFDYYTHWSDRDIPTPTLTNSQIGEYVRAILSTTEQMLKETTVAGIFFLFPIRVAGARARSMEQALTIRRILETISAQGYVAAGAFIVDLDQVWKARISQYTEI